MTRAGTLLFLLISTLVHAQQRYEFTVAADGTGDFTSLQEALMKCKHFADQRTLIRIKPGIYREKTEVFSWTTKISLIGEDARTTVITFDDYAGKDGHNTFTSWTFKIMGDDFYAENITFENNAPLLGQAVAVHIEADRSIFRKCRFLGNQDTIFTGGEQSRQYFVDCYIEGTTDFIFGPATAVFERCHIHSKKNSYITAASTVKGKEFGYVFISCTLTAANDVSKVYLGRPWRNHAKTVFLNCELGNHIRPEGWHNWNKQEAEETVLYAEYNSMGGGASPATRALWSKQLTRKEAEKYTVKTILAGHDNWTVPE